MSQTVNLDAYITRAQAAFALGVSKDTISAWHARGWYSRTGETDPVTGKEIVEHLHLATKPGIGGKLRYRYGDLLQAESDTDKSPHSRRPNGRAGFLRAA